MRLLFGLRKVDTEGSQRDDDDGTDLFCGAIAVDATEACGFDKRANADAADADFVAHCLLVVISS